MHKGGQEALKLRAKIAMAAIVLMVAILYVFSPIPYLISGGNPSSSLSASQILIPALVLPLILALVFLVPKRKADTPVSGRARGDVAEMRFRKKSLLSGAVAGFISAIMLVGLILGGDQIVGLPPGTFYSIIGISMGGLENPAAIYFGVGLHLVTGTLVGTTFGYLTAVIGPFNIAGPARGAAVGVLAGFITFSLLFIPLTRFEVEPSLLRILADIYPGTSEVALENKVVDVMSLVLAGAIVLHVVYGAVMGAITATFLRWRKRQGEIPAESSSIRS